MHPAPFFVAPSLPGASGGEVLSFPSAGGMGYPFSMGDEWHLLKAADREVHGPVSLEQLQGWASEAKIAPMDKVSSDNRQSWVRAPMVRELQMDWLIEMPDNYLYGPTSVGTLQEFLATGEVDENVMVINCLEGTQGRMSEQPFYQASPHHVRSAETVLHGTEMPHDHSSADANAALRQRLHVLEKQVMELQHDLATAYTYTESLRSQFIEATGREPM